MKYRVCTIRVAKTKALISFAVTAKLICVFVFAYAKTGFLITRLNCYNVSDVYMLAYSFLVESLLKVLVTNTNIKMSSFRAVKGHAKKIEGV